jgi:hypothetical protein
MLTLCFVEQFYKASPGTSCFSVAAAHGLTVDQFLSLNPQIGGIDKCFTNLLPHWWYCVKALEAVPAAPVPSSALAPPKPVYSSIRTDSLIVPTITQLAELPTASPAPPPEPTPPPVPVECVHDSCWRGFKMLPPTSLNPAIHASVSGWCIDFLASPCNTNNPKALPGAPVFLPISCTQAPACSAISSACACYTAGLN